MTRFTRPLKRLSEATRYQRGRAVNVVVEIPAGGRVIGFRLAKTRRVYYLPTAALLCEAIRVHQASEKARKKAERAARKS